MQIQQLTVLNNISWEIIKLVLQLDQIYGKNYPKIGLSIILNYYT